MSDKTYSSLGMPEVCKKPYLPSPTFGEIPSIG